MRQNELDLIKAVNELCNGNPSKDTEDLLRSLKRPLSDYTDAVYIFGTNQDCDFLNDMELDKIDSPKRKYTAIDDGKLNFSKFTDVSTNKMYTATLINQ